MTARREGGAGEGAPRLSIVVPVRDRAAPLVRLLAEIDAQRAAAPGAAEVIVVDDASAEPAAVPEGVRLIRLDQRAGANGARAQGLAAARAPYVHFHDSDDGVAPGWLAAVLAALEDGPDIVVTRRIDVVKGAARPAAQRWLEANAERPRRVRRMLALRNCFGPFGGLIFSRAALAATRFPDAASSQDWLVCLDVMETPRRIGLAPDAAFVYRRDGADRISASPRRKALGMFAVARRTRARAPLGPLHRLWHLDYFRVWLAACRRRALDDALRRTRMTRRLARWATLIYAAGALGLR